MDDTLEQAIDLADWDEFCRLDRLSNHWWWRPGWRPGRHFLTWFLLFPDDAVAQSYVSGFQRDLADLDYLDLVPMDGLHLTVHGIDFADLVPDADIAAIASQARDRCADLPPFNITIGPVNAYSGGVFLRAVPIQALAELRRRLNTATTAVRGNRPGAAETRPFKPHLSIAYVHAAEGASELRRRLTPLRSAPSITITVTNAALVELRRDERVYRWEIRELVSLGTPSRR